MVHYTQGRDGSGLWWSTVWQLSPGFTRLSGVSYPPASGGGHHVPDWPCKNLVPSAISSPHESAQVRILTIDTRT